jgi:energy-coupling factor transporter ATP-binding protein EcfA2
MVGAPELLILDEPTVGMDVEARVDFWTAIRSCADRGMTVIFPTHLLEEAETNADRTVVMDGPGADRRRRSNGRDQGSGQYNDDPGHRAGRRRRRAGDAPRRSEGRAER